jgi:hypothetical protein
MTMAAEKRVKSVTVDLVEPVTVEGREYTSLTFRRMKAKDTLVGEGEQNQTRVGYLMFAALAGVDVAVIEELDIEDLEAIGERIIPLMGKSAAEAAKAVKALAAAGVTSSPPLPDTSIPQ